MAAPGENLRINPDRLWESIMEMAKIGPGVAGGNNRQTLTDADGEGRHLFARTPDAIAHARALVTEPDEGQPDSDWTNVSCR